ncbi:MAG: hypothetical protein HRT71_21965 [Flavobacteriales bacterium]|nr:hypothetical protein [Flavobacteriales bacterium]
MGLIDSLATVAVAAENFDTEFDNFTEGRENENVDMSADAGAETEGPSLGDSTVAALKVQTAGTILEVAVGGHEAGRKTLAKAGQRLGQQ